MLVKCPECGKEISDKAVSCPKCNYLMLDFLEHKNDKLNNINEAPVKIRLESKKLEEIFERAENEYNIPAQELGYEVISKRPYIVDIWRARAIEPVQLLKSTPMPDLWIYKY